MAPPRKLGLPAVLRRQLDQEPGRGQARQSQRLPRKEERKQHRVQKRESRRPARPLQTLSKQSRVHLHSQQQHQQDDGSLDDGAENEDLDDFDGLEDNGNSSEDELDENEGLLEESEEDEGDEVDGENDLPHHVPKSVLKKLDQDDAEIAALERKLGIRGKKQANSAADEDGLGSLLDGLESEENADASSSRKRKAEASEWLAEKRRKALKSGAKATAAAKRHDRLASRTRPEDGDIDEDDEDDGAHNSDDSELAGLDDDSFGGFSDQETAVAPRQRENPYVAPTASVAKYIPPSMRKKLAQSDSESEAQLRRRLQGLINRLTNDSMFGIIKDMVSLYDNYPRHSVTAALVDLLLTLVSSPEKRPDAFFTMICGFVAGLHKMLGMQFAASMIQRVVEVLGEHHDQADGDKSDAASRHLMSLISELYNMQVIGSKLVFDYVRLFLSELTELNTELLLVVIQTCGLSLRREDPHALKDIISQIKPSGLKDISVRTSFMIEEMQKLQSNKTKAAARNRDVAEQRTQLRKRIGTLNGPSDVQPLGMSLQDIKNADKNGKWWLVGASWSGNTARKQRNGEGTVDAEDSILEDDLGVVDDDLGIPDLWQLAREQGFNTDVRQRIFVALHAAVDPENAELLIQKLRLNKHQRKEIPEVILRSCEALAHYNVYYSLVAQRFCGNREIAFQFKRSLTTRFRKMGEDIDTGDAEDYDLEESEEYESRCVYHAGKFFGSLVVHGSLGLDLLRYRNLATMQPKANFFVEVLLITVMLECPSKKMSGPFGNLDTDLARAVRWFLDEHVKSSDLLDVREAKIVKKGWKYADAALEESLDAHEE